MLEIEKGIEMPQAKAGVAKYPWKDMEIADSFFVKGGTYDKLSSVASYSGSRHKKKFTARVVPGGVRVWRIE